MKKAGPRRRSRKIKMRSLGDATKFVGGSGRKRTKGRTRERLRLTGDSRTVVQ